PDESHFFMGAQVGWSPQRERSPLTTCPDCGRSLGRCPACGSDGLWLYVIPTIGAEGEWSFVPGKIAPGSLVVCARCMRWGRDDRLAASMVAEYHARGTIDPDPLTADPPACSREQESIPDDPGIDFGSNARTARFRATPDGIVRVDP
ncbi:hypothetical protein, partial [Kosakonia cowanii]|uniref:hypothetical protein n=1 Tax=Kosakonia cowanii TaxID=208223 RepID=UPI004062EC1E